MQLPPAPPSSPCMQAHMHVSTHQADDERREKAVQLAAAEWLLSRVGNSAGSQSCWQTQPMDLLLDPPRLPYIS